VILLADFFGFAAIILRAMLVSSCVPAGPR
jgi:hypothetical protein